MTYLDIFEAIHNGADDGQLASMGRYHYYHHDEFMKFTPSAETLPADRIEDFVKACVAFCWYEGDVVEDRNALIAYMEQNLPAERWAIYKKFMVDDGDILCFFPEYQREKPLEGPFWD